MGLRPCPWITKTTTKKCQELRPCTGLTKTTARKLPRVASLHWAYQNHCQKIAESCVLALGLPKPLPENCRELRPCTGLSKTTAGKLLRAASLHWAYQKHCQKIAGGCILVLGLPKPPQKNCQELRPCTGLTKPLPENWRELRPCTGLIKTSARKLPRAVSWHCAYQTTAIKLPRAVSLRWAYQNHCHEITKSCVLATGLPRSLAWHGPLDTTPRKLHPCTGSCVLALGSPKPLPENC